MYASHLNLPLDFVSLGCLVCLCNRTNGSYFLGLYGYIAMHFSLKMNRLLLICGPITSIMCAIWMGFVLDFITEPFLLLLGKKYPEDTGVFALNATSTKKESTNESPASAAVARGKAANQPAK